MMDRNRPALDPGAKLGSFEISALVGVGGMGEVYLARDSKLGRDVAIKVLPEELSRDKDRLDRFEREARTLASINHPNIAVLHGLESDGVTTFLVMELVSGETLEDRLRRAPISFGEAVTLFGQIAEGLEAAHEQGIVHRDLKPANVKITESGRVKILDFGLAKPSSISASSISDGATRSVGSTPKEITTDGMVLGTPSYMSPEQARGKPVDRRTDIWAFGCCLFEGLAGERPFHGETASDTLAKILETEPRWNALAAVASARLCNLVRRCLQKDPRLRLRDIGDARLELLELADEPAPDRRAGVGRRLAPWALAAATTLLALVVIISALLDGGAGISPETDAGRPTTVLRRFRERPPVDAAYTIAEPGAGFQSSLTVSPDGRHLVYVVIRSEERLLYHRDLSGDFLSRPIPRTEGARSPFFGPNGRWVGFFTGENLKKVSLDTGRVISLCGTIPVASGGCWLDDNSILFTPLPHDGLFRVRADQESGQSFEDVSTRVTTPDRTEGEFGHCQPSLLPGGKKVLLTAGNVVGWDRSRILVHDLESGETEFVVAGIGGRYDRSSGQLVFARDGELFAMSFDPETARATGDAFLLARGCVVRETAEFSLGSSVLAYVPGIGAPRRPLVWVDEKGTRKRLEGVDPLTFHKADVSPTGDRVLLGLRSRVLVGSVRVLDLKRGVLERVSEDDWTQQPVWHPDGQRIVLSVSPFTETRELSPPTLAMTDLERDDGKLQLLLSTDHPQFQGVAQFPTAWSQDGKHILFTNEHAETNLDIWVLALDGDREPRPLFPPTEANQTAAVFSPGDQWVAYQSDEDGRYEIFVVSFTGVGAKRRVSQGGGTEPTWVRATEPSGRLRLYFRRSDQIWFVENRSEDESDFDPSAATPLFESQSEERPLHSSRIGRSYDVDENGRFLMIEQDPDELTTQINVMLDWAALLEAREQSE